MDDLIQVNAIITQGTDLLSNYYYDYELFNYYCALHNEGSVRAKTRETPSKSRILLIYFQNSGPK